jgi:hypothetical protein
MTERWRLATWRACVRANHPVCLSSDRRYSDFKYSTNASTSDAASDVPHVWP